MRFKMRISDNGQKVERLLTKRYFASEKRKREREKREERKEKREENELERAPECRSPKTRAWTRACDCDTRDREVCACRARCMHSATSDDRLLTFDAAAASA